MKKIGLLLVLILPFSRLYAQSIDDRLCWRYFEITEKLRADEPLDKAEWNDFLTNDAIQVYLKDQGVDSAYIESYRQAMEIVYMPKNENVLNERLKDQNRYWWTYIINEYKLHEDEMKHYLLGLQNDQESYFDTCYRYSYTMLPEAYHKKAPEYKVTMIPIHNDAHVRSGWMIFTLMAAYFSDFNKLGVLGGHEFHHVLRPRLVFEVDKEDQVIISLLQRILNEGSADLIDKRYEGENATKLLEFQRGYPESFIAEGAGILKNIDSLLSSADLDKSKLTINKLIDTWNTSGHIPGYYMADIIEKQGYKAELINHIEDPFYFVYLYNKAAEKEDDAYVLSAETMNLVRLLEDKYRKQAKIVALQ
ncbi:DUF5700 domain-containing putative Zn-dependent protease [Parapedobacter koreensis]|uniref:Peptidase MA superfamily protein n=1 Tax=Parapedobacter koreensis TaxID=332977 RepID=A0A1H7PYF6_9SPHI|nr:DUF5700 domain-containing putative Zn-dependent protease [Parapedobacter koreensis]SEL40474.1 hypothetical protein SAMN05421740_10565 [Parapedobacter koreensis]